MLVCLTDARWSVTKSFKTAWALLDFGIRCIIASSFADIFFNNTFKNGMLPVILAQEQIDKLMEDAKAGNEIEVDLPAQVVRRPNGEEIPFEVESFRKHCLVEGLDDINLTLVHEDQILSFEEKRSQTWPWLDGASLPGCGCSSRVRVGIGYRGKIPIGSQKQKIDW
jgi:3-isopropylmalate dehydratase